MKVLISGVTGFVGQHLATELVARGVASCGLVRAPRPGVRIPLDLSIVQRFDDAGQLDRAFDNVTHVVHLAARVHVMRESEVDPLVAYRSANVDATRALCEAARRAGVRKFIYLSTAKVYGDGKDSPYSDLDVPNPRDAYSVSKIEAERTVAGVLNDAVPWTVLRPPLVYGPEVAGNFRRLLQLARLATRVPLPLGDIPNRRSLIYVRNLVDAIIHSLNSSAPRGKTYLVSDGQDLSTSQLIAALAAHLGGRQRLFYCPVRLLRGALWLTGRSAEADRLLTSMAVDSSKFRQELLWRPPFTVEEGLRDTARWWLGRLGAA